MDAVLIAIGAQLHPHEFSNRNHPHLLSLDRLTLGRYLGIGLHLTGLDLLSAEEQMDGIDGLISIHQHVEARGEETYLPGSDEIAERQLQDGSRYRIIKNFVDPERLERRLRGLGWECRMRRDGSDWGLVLGEARPVT